MMLHHLHHNDSPLTLTSPLQKLQKLQKQKRRRKSMSDKENAENVPINMQSSKHTRRNSHNSLGSSKSHENADEACAVCKQDFGVFSFKYTCDSCNSAVCSKHSTSIVLKNMGSTPQKNVLSNLFDTQTTTLCVNCRRTGARKGQIRSSTLSKSRAAAGEKSSAPIVTECKGEADTTTEIKEIDESNDSVIVDDTIPDSHAGFIMASDKTVIEIAEDLVVTDACTSDGLNDESKACHGEKCHLSHNEAADLNIEQETEEMDESIEYVSNGMEILHLKHNLERQVEILRGELSLLRDATDVETRRLEGYREEAKRWADKKEEEEHELGGEKDMQEVKHAGCTPLNCTVFSFMFRSCGEM